MRGKKSDTLCWDCQNYHCDWIAHGKPVKGWKAKETKIVALGTKGSKTGHRATIDSYAVTKCPEFMKERLTEQA